jgi:hypothetical protein
VGVSSVGSVVGAEVDVGVVPQAAMIAPKMSTAPIVMNTFFKFMRQSPFTEINTDDMCHALTIPNPRILSGNILILDDRLISRKLINTHLLVTNVTSKCVYPLGFGRLRSPFTGTPIHSWQVIGKIGENLPAPGLELHIHIDGRVPRRRFWR